MKILNFFFLFSFLFLFSTNVLGQCPPSVQDPSNTGDPYIFNITGIEADYPNPGAPGRIITSTNGGTYQHNITFPFGGENFAQFILIAGSPDDLSDGESFDFGDNEGVCNFNASGMILLVPTLSEWGLIFLALLILTVGVLYSTAPTMQLTNGQTIKSSIDYRNLPFEKNTFFKIWMSILTATIIGFGIAMAFGYKLTVADPFGMVACSAILSYLVMVIKTDEQK